MTSARVVLTDDARQDLRGLDGAARKIVANGIQKLQTDPALRGAPLGTRATGDLTGLRKLVVGNRAYRIVYRVEADGTVAVVLVIAGRADDEVYRLAVARVAALADPERAAALRQLIDTAWDQR